MRPNCTRVETLGSWWYIDDEAQEYLRMPKTEGPRPSPPGEDWGGPSAGALEDLRWHAFEAWRIDDLTGRLVIECWDGHRVSAPGASVR